MEESDIMVTLLPKKECHDPCRFSVSCSRNLLPKSSNIKKLCLCLCSIYSNNCFHECLEYTSCFMFLVAWNSYYSYEIVLSSGGQTFMCPLLRDHTVRHLLLLSLVGVYQGLLLRARFRMHLLRWNLLVITIWILLIVIRVDLFIFFLVVDVGSVSLFRWSYWNLKIELVGASTLITPLVAQWTWELHGWFKFYLQSYNFCNSICLILHRALFCVN